MDLLLWVFRTNYKMHFKHYVSSSRHEIERNAYCDDLSSYARYSSTYRKEFNTLTCTDDLTRLTNAHEYRAAKTR
jgi:hypothetical protein